VKAAADHKEQLKKELKELNERKIQAMAEIEAQEEMEDEEEECWRASGVDVIMDGVEVNGIRPKGLEEENTAFVEDNEESKVEDAQVLMKAKVKVPAKKTSVSFSSFGVRVALMHHQQRAKKPAKGET
jgi:hypothetical protein